MFVIKIPAKKTSKENLKFLILIKVSEVFINIYELYPKKTQPQYPISYGM